MSHPYHYANPLVFHADDQPAYTIDADLVPAPSQLEETELYLDHLRVDLKHRRTPSRSSYNDWYDSPANSTYVLNKKVPCNAVWSPEAIDLLLSGKASNALTKEHVVPYNIQLAYLLKGIEQGRPNIELAQLMISFPDAIITMDQDSNLGKKPDLGVNLKTQMPLPKPGEPDWPDHPYGGFVRHLAGGLDPTSYLPAAEWTQVLMSEGLIDKPLVPRPNPASRPAHQVVPSAMLAGNRRFADFRNQISLTQDQLGVALTGQPQPAPVVPARPLKVDDPTRARTMSAMARFETENLDDDQMQLD